MSDPIQQKLYLLTKHYFTWKAYITLKGNLANSVDQDKNLQNRDYTVCKQEIL